MKFNFFIFIFLLFSFSIFSHEDTSKQMGAMAEINRKPDNLNLQFTYHIDDLETILDMDFNNIPFSKRTSLPNDLFREKILFSSSEPLEIQYSELKAISPVIYTLNVDITLENTSETIIMYYHFIKERSGSDRLALFWEEIDSVLYLHDNYKEVLFNIKNLSMRSNKIIFPETQPAMIILFLFIIILIPVILYFPGTVNNLTRRRDVKS